MPYVFLSVKIINTFSISNKVKILFNISTYINIALCERLNTNAG